MGCRGEKEEVSCSISGNFPNKLMPLLLLTRPYSTGLRRSVGFIHDHKVGTVCNEKTTTGIPLDKINAYDEVRVVLEDIQITAGKIALQPRPRTRPNHLGVYVELGLKLSLPLVAQVRWADYAEATSISPVKQFPCDEPGFYRLANANVVRDEHPHWFELERHDEGHELVGTWTNRQTTDAAKRASATAQPKSGGIA
jgi:hypothetical protein